MRRNTGIRRPFIGSPLATFELAATEVAQGLWHDAMGQNPNNCDVGCDDELPVQNISWIDAIRFLNKWSESDGLKPCYAFTGWSILEQP